MSRATRGSLDVGSFRDRDTHSSVEGSERGRVGTGGFGRNVLCEQQFLRAHQGLIRLRGWIAVNGALDLGFREAATIACLEPHYFSFVFHRCVGITFIEWRRRYRVAYALQAIESGLASIDEIARIAGYSNRRSLERAMKRVVGRTPRSRDHLAGLPAPATTSKKLK